MPHIIATIHKQTYSLTINAEEDATQVTLDDHEHPIDWKQLAPLARDAKRQGTTGGHYSLLLAGRSYDVFARPITQPGAKNSQVYEIFMNGQRFEVATEDERTRKLTGALQGGAHSSQATVYAPMPGLVIGISLAVGAEVKAGQPIIVLEAMKMENDLSSPINGKIKEILVQKGQTVDLGAALVIITGATDV